MYKYHYLSELYRGLIQRGLITFDEIDYIDCLITTMVSLN